MIKLLKHFTPFQWVLAVILLAFLVAQCYFDVTLPAYTSEIITKMQAAAEPSSILSTGLTMLMYAGASIGCTLVITFISFYLSSMQAKTIRGKIYDKVESFSTEELSRFSTPSLITRSTNDVRQVSMAIMLILRIGIAAPLTAVWAILKINAVSFELTTALAIGISFMLAGIMLILFLILPKFKVIQKLTDRINGVTRENLTGIRIIRAFNAEEQQTDKFSEVNTTLTKTNIFTNRIMGLMQPLITLVSYGLTIAIYWLGCYLILKDNNPELFPTMFAFTQLSGQVVMAFMMILMILLMLPRAQVSAKRINEVLDTRPMIFDPENPKEIRNGDIEYKNVSFTYPGAEKAILEDINIKIAQGETVAFIGATGSGKSTIISLLPRFFEVSSGEILIDGVNIKDVRQYDLRGLIGYVPQKSVLFSGTIKDNITLGNLDATDDEVSCAADIACASEFIKELSDGYNSDVSQGGKNLSGGQKQRLSIARAILKKPLIYIFDDSFSALDFKTDAIVRQNLENHSVGATKLIVAQRIGTIKNADNIFVVHEGKIIASGKHEQLLQTSEEYKEIALSQLSAEELGL